MTQQPLTIVHLGIGGSEHIRRLAADQARLGHRVYILADEAQGPYASLNDVDYRFFSGKRRLPIRVQQILAALHETKADVLHSHYLNIGGFLAAFSGFHPHVMHAWGSDVFIAPHYSHLQNLKTRLALRSADWILSPSTSMRDELSRLGFGLNHNEALPWGIDTEHFAPNAEAALAFRASRGLGDAPIVFSPRALHPLYHQDKLIEAWPRVLRDVPKARLLLSKFNAVPEFIRLLENRIEQLELSDSIVWLESLNYETLPAAYSAANLIVSIPRSDAPAITVLEAMACARPVVVSDLRALHEIVKEGANGHLVDVNSPSAIADGTLRVLSLSAAEQERMGRLNRRFVEENARRETTLARIEAIYRSFDRARVSPSKTLRNLARGPR